jgi:ABC-type glutathione transport system ATPase component
MTDEPTTPADNDDVLVVAAQVADSQGVLAEGAIVAEGDHALIVARFADTASAIAIYDRLCEAGAAAG